MEVRYLLDTNSASYVITGDFPRVRERLSKVPMAEVGISTLTEAELRFAVARRPDAAKLNVAIEEFLLRVEVMAWDSAAARHYARIRATLEEQGEPMANLDMMIAAQAMATEAVLVSDDTAFRRVKGLKVDDWTET